MCYCDNPQPGRGQGDWLDESTREQDSRELARIQSLWQNARKNPRALGLLLAHNVALEQAGKGKNVCSMVDRR